MKWIIYIVFAFGAIHGFCQQPAGSQQSPVIEFVDKHLGERVGKGVCFDLVREACEQGDKEWFEKWEHKSKYKIDRLDIHQGDVIVFYSCRFSDGRRTGYHIGIVHSIDNNKIEIAEQNFGSGPKKHVRSYGQKVDVLKNSSVELNEIDMTLLEKGRIEFYRF